MPLDPRTPVLVGCGQVTRRALDLASAPEPLDLMREALTRAADDAGSREILQHADSIRVPRGLWPYANPAALLAEAIGTQRPPQTGLAAISGSTVQRILHQAASEIADGQRDVVLVVGAECEHSKRRAKAAGIELAWTEQSGPPPDETFGSHDPGFGSVELRYRMQPIQTFSLYENALRAHRGEGPAAHRRRISLLWSRLSQIAASNPHAWIREAKSAEEIRTETEDNRMLAYPYTKYLVSNMVVDMGGALILCSVEAARRLGVPEHRWVFPQVATQVRVETKLAERDAYHDQPAMGIGGRRALDLAGCTPADVAHVDLYSCFPSAVQIAAGEIGFDADRDLSVTGGLTFSGGPFNSYVIHSLATMMERLRGDRGSVGFVSSVGGYMAKHAFGVYCSEPRAEGFRHEDCTPRVEALPTRRFDDDYAGAARVESFAEVQAPEGEGHVVLVACLAEDGRRSFATHPDPALIESLAQDELCGRMVDVAGGRFELQ